MTKKAYMKPSMKVIELQHKCQMLAGSVDPNDINDELQGQEVTNGW